MMGVIEWFTFLMGMFFNGVSLIVLLNPSIREQKPMTPTFMLEMVFVLTATIVALQAIIT